jgi:ribosome-associated protein YbcJ (S4-like RNA binding protein)
MKQKVIILLLAFFSIVNLAVPGAAVKAYAEENTVIRNYRRKNK